MLIIGSRPALLPTASGRVGESVFSRPFSCRRAVHLVALGWAALLAGLLCAPYAVADSPPTTTRPSAVLLNPQPLVGGSALTAPQIAALNAAAPPAFASRQELIQRSVRFRRAFGLPGDARYVDGLLDSSSPTVQDARRRYGVPLTAPEVAVVAQRFRIGAALASLDSSAKSYASAFGGVYMNPQGQVWVGFTHHATSYLLALRAAFAYPARLHAFTVRYSLATLDALHTTLDRDMETLIARGIPVDRITTSVSSNAVIVGLREDVPGALTYLQKAYGPAIQIAVESPAETTSRQLSYPPLRGGVQIQRLACLGGTNCLYDIVCTEGFIMQHYDQPLDPYRYYYYYTAAGHCGPVGSSWYHAAYYLGPEEGDLYYNGSNTDALYGQINPPTASNQLFIDDYHHVNIFADQPDGGVRGTPICLTAISSGNVCGTVTNTNVSVIYGDGTQINGLNESSFVPIPGDSGGPVYYGNTAYGEVSGRYNDGSGGLYTPIGNIENGFAAFVDTTCPLVIGCM